MSILNTFICPHCGNQFPIFIKPSMTTRRGFFSKPDIQCQKCGQLCRAKIDFKRSLIVWPLTAVYLVIMYFLLEASQLPCKLNKEGLWLLSIIVVFSVFLIPILVGIRSGFILIKAQDDMPTRHQRLRELMQILFVGVFCIGFGYYTGDWMEIIIGLVVGIIISLIFYILRKKENRKSL